MLTCAHPMTPSRSSGRIPNDPVEWIYNWADGAARWEGVWNGSRPQCDGVCSRPYPDDPDSVYCKGNMASVCNGFENVSDELYSSILTEKKGPTGLSWIEYLQLPNASFSGETGGIPTNRICSQTETHFGCLYDYLCKWCAVRMHPLHRYVLLPSLSISVFLALSLSLSIYIYMCVCLCVFVCVFM